MPNETGHTTSKPTRFITSGLLPAVALVALAALVILSLLSPAAGHAAGSEWTAQQLVGPSYTGTTFPERYRYVNPQVLAFSNGTAEAIWSDIAGPAPGIRGRHLGTDGIPTGTPYDLSTPTGTEGLPNAKVAPLTGNLGVVVLDTPVRNTTDRVIRARLIGPNGPTGANFDVRAIPNSTPVGSLDVASNGDGTATAAWAEFDGTAYSVQERQIAVGGVMGPAHLVSEPIERPENSVATNSVEVRGHGDGTASIAWSESPVGGGTNLKVRRVGSAGVMGSIRQIASGWIGPPRIAAHADGSVTAVWGENGNWRTVLYVTRVSAGGVVSAPENVCVLGYEQSSGGQQCLDIAPGAFGSASFRYDVAANGNGSSTVVARRAPNGDVVSWRVDSQGQAGTRTTLEALEGTFGSPEPQVVGDGEGNVLAVWTGKMPSSSLTALHAARIGLDNNVVGDQALFPLAGGSPPAQVLAGPALTAGRTSALPIWSVWSDWTASPADDPTATRQVYAARYPRIITPTIRPTRMVAFGDSYTSGEGLLAEVGLRYDCGTDMKKARYRRDTTVLAMRSWTSEDCDTRTLTNNQPADLYSRGVRTHENECNRHRLAYPNQLRAAFGIKSKDFLFVACRGAETKNIGLLKKPLPVAQYPNSPVNVHGGKTQVSTADQFAKSAPPDLVTIGIGGNDAGFGAIIRECIASDCLKPVAQARAIANIAGVTHDRLVETFSKLRNRYRHASVLAFGYPEVVGDPDKPCAPIDVGGAYTISHDELEWLKTKVEPAINSAVSDAAAKAGVAYIDIVAVTRGHELCSDTHDRWINGRIYGDDIEAGPLGLAFESFHPTQKAHNAIGRYFVDRYTDGHGRLLVSSPAFMPLEAPPAP